MNWFRNALLLLPLASAGPGLAQQAAVRVEITGMVFVDQNANGLRDSGEPGLGNAVVSDQSGVVTTGVDGTFRLDRPGQLAAPGRESRYAGGRRAQAR